MLWSLYQLRLRQVVRRFNQHLEARVSERTRIARDLHDTLLQTFHGVLFRLQAVSDVLPQGAAKERLDSAIDLAAQAITEGRDAVQDIRSSTEVSNNLSQAIGALGQELAANDGTHHPAAFRTEVAGTPRDLHPILRDDVYRIAGEALRNAFWHSQARQIEVEIRYEEQQFRLCVRDDGKGLDALVLDKEERPGHWGLHGMRERAKLIGGKLEVWSKVASGTEIELTIPAALAYTTARAPRWPWLFRNRTLTKP
jgi:signal transduction histidine kinase